jgi:glycine cleavage system T protein (aminomethyltransferase)
MTEPLRKSPLDAQHRSLDARMVPFGGWDMPLQYPGGVLEEHRACRTGAVVFDVSHLGTVECSGAGSLELLQWLLTNDLRKIGPGRAQYTHLLDPHDAHVVDDIIVWWVDADRFFVMPNASNTDEMLAAFGEGLAHTDGDVEFADITPSRAVLAVQGPNARVLLATVDRAASEVPRFAVRTVGDLVVAGTGYTGEDGVEIHVAAAAAPALWEALIGAGITPAGLGARDTLRLEAGLPLHGHELGAGITPLQAGLGWVVGWDKAHFRGRAVLAGELEAGIARRLRGMTVEGRRPPRAGSPVVRDGNVVGEVTSGNFSPMLGHGIALAFVPPAVQPGDSLQIDVRGQLLDARVVPLPFVKR